MKEQINGINGNEVDLDDIMKMAKEITESIAKKEQDNMEQFKRIVEGVARKYGSIYVDREDLEQELWIVVLEKIRDFGGADKVDPRFIARCCYNKAVDFYRYSRRRKDSSARLIEEMGGEDDENNSENTLLYSTFENGYDRVILKEIIELFPQGSRQRKYVVTKLYMYGEISKDDGLTDKLEMPEGETESDVLKLLGYKSRYPASWGKMKYQIRETIYKYLGILPDTECSETVEELVRNRVEAIFRGSKSGYIDVSRLLKDKALILLGADSEMIWRAVGSSSTLLRGLTKDGKQFIMKDEDRYLLNSAQNEDVIIPRN